MTHFGVQGKYIPHTHTSPHHLTHPHQKKNRYALYSSLSPGFQKYLEGLTALHSAVAQADGARAAGKPVRREPIETVHPVVRVHPATGFKSVYVNPGKRAQPPPYPSFLTNKSAGFTRRIIGVPKAESDSILNFLFHQIGENPDFQVRFHWEPNSIALWDNRVSRSSPHRHFHLMDKTAF